ncbi:unnamed protein product [Calypogeia fissa]
MPTNAVSEHNSTEISGAGYLKGLNSSELVKEEAILAKIRNKNIQEPEIALKAKLGTSLYPSFSIFMELEEQQSGEDPSF